MHTMIMKRKCKQWWSTKRTATSHFNH